MEAGFMESIAGMLREDRGLFYLLACFIGDGRQRVRIGAVALAETMLQDFREDIIAQIPEMALALRNPDPTARADAAYMLSVLRDASAAPFLEEAIRREPAPAIKEAMREALLECNGNS
jgi:hypothetical protein